MKEKKLNNFDLYEIDGELYSLNELKGFIESSKELERQTRFNRALKFRCHELATRNLELESEVADMKFTRKYLTSEDAGKAFAQELLHPDTNFIKAEEAAEQLENEVVGAMGSFLGDDY